MLKFTITFIFFGFQVLLCFSRIVAFVPWTKSSGPTCLLFAKNEQKKGYQFGDVTKGLINSVTGKKEYDFGDLSRWIDAQAKNTAKEFTKKQEYEFGDISKEITRRIRDGEYSQEDLMVLLKIVVTVGINFQPIARLLPVKALIQMLNLSMSQKLGDQIKHVLTMELDKRMKEMMTGDIKEELSKQAIQKFTGQDSYTFGDISKAIAEKKQGSRDDEIVMSDSMEKELDEWDSKHQFVDERGEHKESR